MGDYPVSNIPAELIDVILPEDEQGYPAHLANEDTPDVLWDVCGSASRAFPQSLWIEPKDWADKARDNDKYHTWPSNYVDRFTNQQPTHECTCHSLTRNFEGAWNRHRGIIYPNGPVKDFRYDFSQALWASPLSVYAEANPDRWGGANVRQVLEIAIRRGILPESVQPRDYHLKHTLHGTTGKGGKNQASGPWVAVKNFPEGWQETAKHFRPLEVIFPESWEQAVCLVLNGLFVSVGRNGHAVPWSKWVVSDDVMEYVDSYDTLRYDSLRTVKTAWKGSFAIATVTRPDDWDYPAGK